MNNLIFGLGHNYSQTFGELTANVKRSSASSDSAWKPSFQSKERKPLHRIILASVIIGAFSLANCGGGGGGGGPKPPTDTRTDEQKKIDEIEVATKNLGTNQLSGGRLRPLRALTFLTERNELETALREARPTSNSTVVNVNGNSRRTYGSETIYANAKRAKDTLISSRNAVMTLREKAIKLRDEFYEDFDKDEDDLPEELRADLKKNLKASQDAIDNVNQILKDFSNRVADSMYDALKPLARATSGEVRGPENELLYSNRLNWNGMADGSRNLLSSASITDATDAESVASGFVAQKVGEGSFSSFLVREGKSWSEINGNMKKLVDGPDSPLRPVVKVSGRISQFFNTVPSSPDVTAGGINDDANWKGIPGRLVCIGDTDCAVNGGNLSGNWYFTPDIDESDLARERFYILKSDGTYELETLYAEYGYWLTATDDNGNVFIKTYADTGIASGDVDNHLGTWRKASSEETGDLSEETATYSGNARGYSVRKDDDYTHSGTFKADVKMTATFDGDDSTLGGTINNFRSDDGNIDAVNRSWSVTLVKQKIEPTSNGVVSGHVITPRAEHSDDRLGLARSNRPDGSKRGSWNVIQSRADSNEVRPELLVGGFNAFFKDGAVAGSYAVRKNERASE